MIYRVVYCDILGDLLGDLLEYTHTQNIDVPFLHHLHHRRGLWAADFSPFHMLQMEGCHTMLPWATK